MLIAYCGHETPGQPCNYTWAWEVKDANNMIRCELPAICNCKHRIGKEWTGEPE